jgi:hypothetical protein
VSSVRIQENTSTGVTSNYYIKLDNKLKQIQSTFKNTSQNSVSSVCIEENTSADVTSNYYIKLDA